MFPPTMKTLSQFVKGLNPCSAALASGASTCALADCHANDL